MGPSERLRCSEQSKDAEISGMTFDSDPGRPLELAHSVLHQFNRQVCKALLFRIILSTEVMITAS
jgi:hypothetical protein